MADVFNVETSQNSFGSSLQNVVTSSAVLQAARIRTNVASVTLNTNLTLTMPILVSHGNSTRNVNVQLDFTDNLE
jgi:hypothetical protein